MTATFWTVAALLCAVAVAILFVPLWRLRRAGAPWSPVGIAVALLIAPVAIALYSYTTTWDARLADRIERGTELVDELARRLQSNPNDVEGWLVLAAAYMQLGRYPEGRATYERAWNLVGEPSAELKLAYAEAQILADQTSLSGQAGRLIEEVLATTPSEPKALWFGGFVALQAGRTDVARSRWTSLLALNPPADVANVIRTQLASLGGAVANAASATPEPSGPTIRIAVSLGAGRSIEQLGPNAQLFIIARAPEGGPPIAVIRQPASAVPGEFTLSDANTMIQGRSLANYEELTLVARLSASGQPLEQPGDWQAETTYRPADAGVTLALVIDQVVQ